MLRDKVVVITGGAGLIGRAFVDTVLKNNGVAVIADIDQQAIDNAIQMFSEKYSSDRIIGITADIISKDSLQSIISFLKEKFGKIDALVNNAYPRNENYGRKFEEVTYKDFSENVSLHLGGYFYTSQQFAQYFKDQRYGNIIFISSIYGITAPDFSIYENTPMTMPVEYAVVKSAIIHLTKYIATYYKGYNIRCNCICPGGIENNQPQTFIGHYNQKCLNKGMLKPNDLEGTLLYLLSDASQFVNGQSIVVDDGFTL